MFRCCEPNIQEKHNPILGYSSKQNKTLLPPRTETHFKHFRNEASTHTCILHKRFRCSLLTAWIDRVNPGPMRLLKHISWNVLFYKFFIANFATAFYLHYPQAPQSALECNPKWSMGWHKSFVPGQYCFKCTLKHICNDIRGSASAQVCAGGWPLHANDQAWKHAGKADRSWPAWRIAGVGEGVRMQTWAGGGGMGRRRTGRHVGGLSQGGGESRVPHLGQILTPVPGLAGLAGPDFSCLDLHCQFQWYRYKKPNSGCCSATQGKGN